MRYRHDEYKQKVLDTVPSVAIFQLAEVTHTKKYNKSYHNIFHLPHQYNFFYFIEAFSNRYVLFKLLFFLAFFFFFFLSFFFWGGGVLI